MAGLIGTGTGLRQKAQQGLTAVANLENQRNMQQDSLDAAAKAQEMQLYGTGMGIGGAYGVNKALAAKGATDAVAGGGFVSPTGGMGAMSQSANAGAAQSEAVRSTAANVKGIFAPKAGLAKGANASAVVGQEAAKAAGQEAVKVAGQEAVKAAGTEATKAVAAEGATAAAGSSSGALSALGTIATPIAIGLGAAFLLNKLFG
jgi:hypothetical protein